MATQPWLSIRLTGAGAVDAQVHITEEVVSSDEVVHTVVHAQSVELPTNVIADLANALKGAVTPGLQRKLRLASAQTLIAVERNIALKPILAKIFASVQAVAETAKTSFKPPE